MEWTTITLAIINIVGGLGWLFDRRKHKQEVEGLKAENLKKKQEVEGLKADNRQKEMNLSKMYVDEFKQNIAEPLRREVRELKKEVKKLNNAIGKIQDCPHAADCPVYDELQKQQNDDDRVCQNGGDA